MYKITKHKKNNGNRIFTVKWNKYPVCECSNFQQCADYIKSRTTNGREWPVGVY